MTVQKLTTVALSMLAILALCVGIESYFRSRCVLTKKSVATHTIQSMDISIDQFKTDFGRYPTTEEGIKALLVVTSDSRGSFGPYVKKANDLDPWEHPYVYKFPGIHNPGRFDLYSTGPDGKEGGGDDIGNWSNDGK